MDADAIEDDTLLRWRSDRFEELGCDECAALELAASDVDWHQLESLLADGCDLAVATNLLT